jgi:hypothetical protein
VDGHKSNAVTAAGARAAGLEARRFFTVNYLMRFLQPVERLDRQTGAPADLIDEFMRLAAPVADRALLARLWSREEAEWQCLRRHGAVCSVSERGSRRGLLTGYVMQVADQAGSRCLLVEDILWGTLEPGERVELLGVFLNRAAAEAQLVIVPLLGYADMEPFLALGFRRSTRALHAYLIVWSGPSVPREISAVYLDVV